MICGEALNPITYMLNKCSTKKLKIKVYGEAWSVRNPSVKHLKVFKSLCFKHIHGYRISKLDDESECMVFIRYFSTWVYKFYNHIGKRVHTNMMRFSMNQRHESDMIHLTTKVKSPMFLQNLLKMKDQMKSLMFKEIKLQMMDQ